MVGRFRGISKYQRDLDDAAFEGSSVDTTASSESSDIITPDDIKINHTTLAYLDNVLTKFCNKC